MNQVVITNARAEMMVNANAEEELITPAGISRFFVRGLSASNFLLIKRCNLLKNLLCFQDFHANGLKLLHALVVDP